jgi:hypothetical protein
MAPILAFAFDHVVDPKPNSGQGEEELERRDLTRRECNE